VAVEVLDKFQQNVQTHSIDLARLTEIAQQQVPKMLVQNWRQSITSHWESNPFQEQEWQRLLARDGEEAVQNVTGNPILAYGATVLAVLLADSFILYVQLGDGDILCVRSNERVFRPLPEDKRLIANETTSLCTRNSWQDVRVHIAPVEAGVVPNLILLSTDGYANSFKSDIDFLQVGPDYSEMIKEEGLCQVAEQLPAILEEASRDGSGDDITLGIIYLLPENNDEIARHLTSTQPPHIPEETMTRSQERVADLKSLESNFRSQVRQLKNQITLLSVGLGISILVGLSSVALGFYLLSSKGASQTAENTNLATNNNQKKLEELKNKTSALENKTKNLEGCLKGLNRIPEPSSTKLINTQLKNLKGCVDRSVKSSEGKNNESGAGIPES
jgi:serine/threonine protein phosphatase PrpC